MLETRSLTYAQSVNAALSRALSTLPETIFYGEDVGLGGGIFGVSKGLKKQFQDRVLDTPISETAILGSAVGAAMLGRRPIVEIMWVDFTLVALDQLVNQAANVRYLSQGRLTAPITVRTQQGSSPGACAQHSQSLEAFFAHVPGLRVCMPATPQDAHDLLLESIWCDDPTIVIENRTLYHGEKADVVLGGPIQAPSGAQIKRAGSDVTLVTWGSMLHKCLDAANVLADEGVSVEVVDLRWLRHLDRQTLDDSLRRTRNLVVVHEAHTFAGLGAEIVAGVIESQVELDSVPVRVGTPGVRIPAAPVLLASVIPSTEDIVRAVIRQRSASTARASAQTPIH